MAKGRRECAPKVQDTVAAAQRAVFQEQKEGCRVADFRSQTSARDVRVEADNARRVSRRANLSKLGRGQQWVDIRDITLLRTSAAPHLARLNEAIRNLAEDLGRAIDLAPPF